MSKPLLKAAIMGKAFKQSVELVHPGSNEVFEITVRPLGCEEAIDIQRLLASGMEMTGDPAKIQRGNVEIKGDLGQITENAAKAALKAVVRGIVSDEQWTEEDIAKNWPPVWVNKAAMVIYQISGIRADKGLVQSFRRDTGSAGNVTPDSIGDTTGK